LEALQDLGLATRRTPVSGTSGGALVSGLSCLGVPDKDANRIYKRVDDTCRGQWSCAGQLDATVKSAMRDAVSAAMRAAGISATAQVARDAFVRDRCSNVARLTVTKINHPAQRRIMDALNDVTPLYVTDFKNEEDFVNAGSASAFIPLFSGREAGVPAGQGWHSLFRGDAAVDGGFSAPLPPCASGSDPCVKVVATTEHLVTGKKVGGFPATTAPKAGPALDSADIRPGKYSPLPMGLTYETWQRHALIAPSDAMAAAMQQHGRDQAVAWACDAYPKLMKGQQAACAAAVKGSGGAGAKQQQQAPPRKMMLPAGMAAMRG
jgi:hypothetical protein